MIVRARPEIDGVLIREIIKNKNSYSETPSSYFFFNSGSASLRFFLRMIGEGKRVGVQVYTCSTVKDAIIATGCIPVFLDIDTDYYTTTVDIVKDKINEMDVLILSHLFGIPNPDYYEIKKICEGNNVVLIDDLCQTFHAKIGDKYIENLSENYFYSFFYDKPISSIAGGMLKVSDEYHSRAAKRYSELPEISRRGGCRNLKILLHMHNLLKPELFTREFRYGQLWKLFLAIWPLEWSIKVLDKLLVNKFMRVLCRIINGNNDEEIYRMSAVERFYINEMMTTYSDHNQNLLDFCNFFNVGVPKYMQNKGITCSIAKRAILSSSVSIEGLQVGLYNWPRLICPQEENSKYPGASYVLNNCTNIPCWINISNIYKL